MLEVSAGAVVYTIIENKIYYVIIHDNNGNFGFPKGHQESQESLPATAIREIKEEIGIDIGLDASFKKDIFYTLPNGNNKQATYYLGYYHNQELVPQHEEIKEILLLPYKEALEKINFVDVKAILESAHQYILKELDIFK